MSTFVFRTPYSRRLSDPYNGGMVKRHILFCLASDLPKGLPSTPNPRQKQNLDRVVYKDVAASLRNRLGEPNTFHLKNKGITIIAATVERRDGKEEHFVTFEDGQGILDGGHTYEIIQKAMEAGECPSGQYVKVEILEGIDSRLIEEIALGLNTSVQVQAKTIADQRGQFDWIKRAVEGEPFANVIRFRENEDLDYEIRKIVAVLTLFNVHLFANDDAVQNYPIGAYTSKERTLDRYLDDEGTEERPGKRTYRKLLPILCDILRLHDIVASTSGEFHKKVNKGKPGGLVFVDYTAGEEHSFPFSGTKSAYRLHDGALYPALGAFRYLVEMDPQDGTCRWKTVNGLSGALQVWERAAGEVMRTLQDQSDELGRSVNAMGKNRSLWSNLYNIVKAKALEVERELVQRA